MADGKEKSLEMRVAELEDKLSQVHISEEDMATYNKVAAKLGAGGGVPCAPSVPCVPSINPCVQHINPCVAQVCIRCIRCIINPIIHPITWNDCIGPCAPGNCAAGGAGGGGGFGGFGGG